MAEPVSQDKAGLVERLLIVGVVVQGGWFALNGYWPWAVASGLYLFSKAIAGRVSWGVRIVCIVTIVTTLPLLAFFVLIALGEILPGTSWLSLKRDLEAVVSTLVVFVTYLGAWWLDRRRRDQALQQTDPATDHEAWARRVVD